MKPAFLQEPVELPWLNKMKPQISQQLVWKLDLVC